MLTRLPARSIALAALLAIASALPAHAAVDLALVLPDDAVWADGFEPSATLTVDKSGVGDGTVTSAPPRISCGDTCTRQFTLGTVVTLTATRDASSVFTAWSGVNCPGTGTCTVTMDAAKNVTANFAFSQVSLTPTEWDFGSVASGGNSEVKVFTLFNNGGSTAFLAINVAGVDFARFTGVQLNCGASLVGMGTCNVGVRFSPTTLGPKTGSLNVDFSGSAGTLSSSLSGLSSSSFQLTVDKFGAGTVTSTPAGISCGSDCTEFYGVGAGVVLLATEDANWTFTGWTGANCPGNGTCSVTMDAAKTVSAIFESTLVTVTPSAWDFGSVASGGDSEVKVFAVANNGGSPVTLGITVTGVDFERFVAIQQNCGFSLNPMSTCNVGVRFSPTTPGPKTGWLEVSNFDRSSLSGTSF